MNIGKSDAKFLTWVLAVVTVTTIVAQIVVSALRTLTPTEVALFSVMQLLCSMGVSWVLSQISFRREFTENQQHFAVAAFRRIKEIEFSLGRILARTRLQMATQPVGPDYEAIHEIAIGIQKTIQHSVADWGDVIGEAIRLYEKAEQAAAQPGKSAETEQLVSSLPYSLQILTRPSKFSDLYHDKLAAHMREFEKEEAESGGISVVGQWEPDFGPMELRLGDHLSVNVGDAGTWHGVFVAKNATGQSVAVLQNRYAGPYMEYLDALIRYLGRSCFDVEVQRIEEDCDDDGRLEFTGRVTSKS